MIRNIVPYPSTLFSIDDRSGEMCYVAEASDLIGVGGLRFSRIYDDAADIGIAICDENGIVRRYYSEEPVRDADRDVSYWNFHLIDEDRRRLRLLPGPVAVIVFND